MQHGILNISTVVSVTHHGGLVLKRVNDKCPNGSELIAL